VFVGIWQFKLHDTTFAAFQYHEVEACGNSKWLGYHCPFQHLGNISFLPLHRLLLSLPSIYISHSDGPANHIVQVCTRSVALHAFSPTSSPFHFCSSSQETHLLYLAPSLTRVAIFSSIALSSRPVYHNVVSHMYLPVFPKSHMLPLSLSLSLSPSFPL
jgi:hypothetical protein